MTAPVGQCRVFGCAEPQLVCCSTALVPDCLTASVILHVAGISATVSACSTHYIIVSLLLSYYLTISLHHILLYYYSIILLCSISILLYHSTTITLLCYSTVISVFSVLACAMALPTTPSRLMSSRGVTTAPMREKTTTTTPKKATNGVDDDHAHAAACKLGVRRCVRCRWARHKEEWRERHPLDVQDRSRGSWIVGCVNQVTKTFGLGCSVCNAAGANTAFGRVAVRKLASIQVGNFTNHELSSVHRSSVATVLFGCSPKEFALQHAPAKEDFSKVLQETRRGGCGGEAGVRDVGRRLKVRRMKWALAEAKRSINRARLGRAGSISLHSDSTRGRLAVRFICCGPELEPHAGLLGQVDLAQQYQSLNAHAISKGIVRVIEKACTPLLDSPFGKSGKVPVVDQNLRYHIHKTVELLDTDAAEDEVLAGKVLRGKRPLGEGNIAEVAVLPSVRVCNRDKVHGTKRTRVTMLAKHTTATVPQHNTIVEQ